VGKQSGVEYPTLDGSNHKHSCKVWNGPQWSDACSCGVDTIVEARPLEGFSKYEFRKDFEVRNLQTGMLLNHANDRNTVVLVHDTGSRLTRNVWDLVRQAFMEAA